jgi:hypothetical protein
LSLDILFQKTPIITRPKTKKKEKKPRALQARDAFEDTSFKLWFEIVKF